MLAARTRTTSIAIFISNASIFLPRNSGVRPTIRPAMNTAMIEKIRIPYMPAPAPPGTISPSWISNSGIRPPIGRKLSCHALIAPVLVPVVTAENRPPAAEPKRMSLPSMLPRAESMPAGRSGLARTSLSIAIAAAPPTTMSITAKRAQPWRRSPAIRPKVNVRPNGMMRMRNISNQLVKPLGLSKGWAELALKKPPPLLPSSLMTSCEATGPTARSCCAPCTVVATTVEPSVWTTPWDTRINAPTTLIGSRM